MRPKGSLLLAVSGTPSDHPEPTGTEMAGLQLLVVSYSYMPCAPSVSDIGQSEYLTGGP